ncbi:hypothetical protein [Nocardioides sp. B-3]|uniref:hypothetical protein n=1 Tax=Nocardioides sp. B-3 TaxID=2895565 RepID=UPI002153186C|nr:hypothetical protein [Nocardioides sp. B-3]UUZ60475.1 hypothetical protein LP418_06220 [Nocardioides sp. B-3]
MRASTVRGTVLVCVAVAPVAGCGDKAVPETVSASRPTEVLAATGLVTTSRPTTVLDDGDGPELCLGGVAQSLPPQCSGPAVLDWARADHAGAYEEANGVRWGDFTLVGEWDGTAFTPTEVVAGGDVPESRSPETTPCTEPPGGWTVLDPAMTTDATRGKLMRAAAARPRPRTGVGGPVDQSALAGLPRRRGLARDRAGHERPGLHHRQRGRDRRRRGGRGRAAPCLGRAAVRLPGGEHRG